MTVYLDDWRQPARLGPVVDRWSHLVAPEARVLDLASGSGRHVRWFAQRGCRVTAVDRDDLADGGAAVFASTVRLIHKLSPEAKVECLTGDFAGDLSALDIVLEARPEVLAHNLETVRRLQSTVRDKRANFDQSLAILRRAKAGGLVRYTKTSLMVGFGETEDEIESAMDEARAAGVDIFTLGQYLQPSKRHLEVAEYVTPEKFERLRLLGVAKGFRQVVSSPLSRSSYHAEQVFTV